MKKLVLGVSIAALIGLTGCGSESIDELKQDTPIVKPLVRVVFDPANSDLNVPNDLLMIPSDGDVFDFTINTVSDGEFNAADPLHALSALDGWSTHHPFQIRVILPEDNDIDPASLNAPGAIRIFEATQALEGTSTQCQEIAAASPAPGIPCELGTELQYGQDFVSAYTPGTAAITVVPLKPMKPSQGHVLVVTDQLKDTQGLPVSGSVTWDLVRQDIVSNPLGTPEQLQLQGLVNFLVDVLEPTGLAREDVSYAAYFSTQSMGGVLATVKQLQIAAYAQAFAGALAQGLDQAAVAQFAAQYLPTISTALPDTGLNAFEVLGPLVLSAEQLAQLTALGLNTCSGLMSALADPSSPLFATASETFSTAGPLCAATRVLGQVDLPYYLSKTNPKGDWWKAACTNSAMLQSLGAEAIGGLIQGGAVGVNNDYCQLASGGQLFDLDLSVLDINDPRHLTKVSPIPLARGSNADNLSTPYNEGGTETVNVQFTVPDESIIAAISVATGGAIPLVTKPSSGWPVVIFQHGITGMKENTLALSAALSLAGFASAAIDHPLHGERAIVMDDGSIVSASSHLVTDYLNLESLLTGRDNSRQSIADTLALRLALHAIVDSTGLLDLDLSEVHFAGQSLGSITGAGTVANANTNLPGELAAFDSMYAFKTAVLNVPAGGIPSFLLESADFGPLVKGSLLAGSSEAFVQFLSQYADDNSLPLELAIRPAFTAYEVSLSAEQRAEINATFSAFAFAAQTVLDPADPINYAARLSTNTAILMQLVVGGGTNDDGSTALTDQVNAVETALPLAGGHPLSQLMGLAKVSQTSAGSGVVRFISGEHQSLLTPAPSVAAMTEMQRQAVAFFATNGQSIVVTDESVVEN